MLLFMPERIYEYFKNDEILNEKLEKVRLLLLNPEHHYDLKDLLKMNNEMFTDVHQYLLEKVPEDLKEEMKICSDNHKGGSDKYMINFDNYDDETKIFLLYIYNNGDMSPNDALYDRYNKIEQIYEKNEMQNFSPFIHTIYYFVKLFLHWVNNENIKYVNENGFFPYENIKKFLSFEEDLYNKILLKCNTEQLFHILFHKRIQMMFMFMLFIGQFSDNFDKVVDDIVRRVYNNRFKYDNFNYLKIAINHIFFQTYFDKGNFIKAKKYLMYNISIINYGFSHKFEMVKALNHFNKIFNREFCNYLFFLYTMIRVYIPKLQKEFNILNCPDATEFEKRLLFGKFNDDEKNLGIDTNPNEWLSFKWCQNNKVSFDYFNQIVDKIN